MSRVDETRDAQRAQEQRRVEEMQKEKIRREGQQFSRVAAKSQQAAASAKTKQQQQQGQKASQRATAGQALMARRGIQSNQLVAKMQAHGKDSVEHEQVGLSSREGEHHDNRRVSDERGAEQDRRADTHEVQQQNDRLAAISRDDPRGQRGGGDMGGDTGAESHLGGGQPQLQGGAQVAASSAALGSAGARIPAHVIEELVKRVMVGVNPQGLSEFHIEFRENVLAGSRLTITAKDGKISAQFATPDANTKRLLKASEGELARAFSRKGLTLERFDVTGPDR